MTTAATMFDAHPHLPPVDTRLHADTVEALLEAARTARQCADACLHESATDMRRCITLDLDVADLTSATSNLVIRLADPTSVRAALAACREVLRACAEECRSHGSHLRHCAICAEVCERAEEQCLRMEAAVGHLCVVGDDVVPADPTGVTDRADAVPEEFDITTGHAGRPPIHIVAGGGLGDGAD